MSRRSKILVSKSIYQVGIITLIASIVWVLISVYSALRDPVDIKVDPEMLKPLNPSLNQEVLDQLKSRRQMEGEWSQLERIVVATPTPEPVLIEPEQVASPAAVAQP